MSATYILKQATERFFSRCSKEERMAIQDASYNGNDIDLLLRNFLEKSSRRNRKDLGPITTFIEVVVQFEKAVDVLLETHSLMYIHVSCLGLHEGPLPSESCLG
jgi:hypothetical protein